MKKRIIDYPPSTLNKDHFIDGLVMQLIEPAAIQPIGYDQVITDDAKAVRQKVFIIDPVPFKKGDLVHITFDKTLIRREVVSCSLIPITDLKKEDMAVSQAVPFKIRHGIIYRFNHEAGQMQRGFSAEASFRSEFNAMEQVRTISIAQDGNVTTFPLKLRWEPTGKIHLEGDTLVNPFVWKVDMKIPVYHDGNIIAVCPGSDKVSTKASIRALEDTLRRSRIFNKTVVKSMKKHPFPYASITKEESEMLKGSGLQPVETSDLENYCTLNGKEKASKDKE